MRLFLAVDPGKECLAALAKVTKDLRASAPDAKWVREEGRHVTLVFLGDVDDEKLDEVARIAGEVVRKYEPIALRIEGGGCFGGRKPRVLWVGVRGDVVALCKMQRELADALVEMRQDKDEHGYTPHLTLARAREARGDPRLCTCADALASEVFGEIEVRDVVLYKSELSPAGARYTPMARLPLA